MTDYILLKGVDKLYYAPVTQDDVDAYAADTPVALAPLKVAVQTPSANSRVEYFDNIPMFSLSAEGDTKIKLDITELPLDIQAVLLGKVYDATQEALYDNGGTPPDIALGFRALNTDGTYTLYWFLKGTIAPFPEEVNTQTDTPDPKGVSLEYTAVRTIHQFDLDGSIRDSVKRVKSRKQADVATWFDAVKVPVVGSPAALTCTPSPVDGASGVVVGSNVTLTFSNPLAGNAETGILLIDQDTQAAVAVARTVNAARTVVTLDPSSNLGALTDYLIAVHDVVDVYGQALANVVYNFTTA